MIGPMCCCPESSSSSSSSTSSVESSSSDSGSAEPVVCPDVFCTWRWSSGLGVWQAWSDFCGDCVCSGPPSTPGTFNGELQNVDCYEA